ncbi:MAG TPA: heavy-metal-associated domain-containing protein [bacterium]|jgi:Cu+-exporting ATPase
MQMTLKVPRIHCDGCVNTVTRAVQRLPGVESVQASEMTKIVNVEFDPDKVNEDQIRAALQLVGYPPA